MTKVLVKQAELATLIQSRRDDILDNKLIVQGEPDFDENGHSGWTMEFYDVQTDGEWRHIATFAAFRGGERKFKSTDAIMAAASQMKCPKVTFLDPEMS